jgi:septal ring factor EnvC (AmiA/AmiB activator)
LERFTQKQYDLLFKSDLLNFSSEYGDVFSMSKQIDIYNSMQSDAEKEREEVQNQRALLLETISSLEDSIALLDNDIENVASKVNKINSEVIRTK